MTQLVPHTTSPPPFSSEDKQQLILKEFDYRQPLIIHRPPSNEYDMGRGTISLETFRRRQSDHQICPAELVKSRNLPRRAESARYKSPRTPLVPKPVANLAVAQKSNLQRSHSARCKRSTDADMRERTGSYPKSLAIRKGSQGTATWAKPQVNKAEARFLALPESESFQRLRNFSVQKGCVINRGDSFRRRQDSSTGLSFLLSLRCVDRLTDSIRCTYDLA